MRHAHIRFPCLEDPPRPKKKTPEHVQWKRGHNYKMGKEGTKGISAGGMITVSADFAF
jgi:hypothetical protein